MNLMQLLAFGFAPRIVAWHFLPFSSDVFAHELCVFMIYVPVTTSSHPLAPESPLSPSTPSKSDSGLSMGWDCLVWFGFRLVTCCVVVGFFAPLFC